MPWLKSPDGLVVSWTMWVRKGALGSQRGGERDGGNPGRNEAFKDTAAAGTPAPIATAVVLEGQGDLDGRERNHRERIKELLGCCCRPLLGQLSPLGEGVPSDLGIAGR